MSSKAMYCKNHRSLNVIIIVIARIKCTKKSFN